MEIEQGKELVSKTSSQNLVQVSSPTKITGVHYVQVITSSSSSYIITNGIVINFERGQGAVVFHDVFDNEHNVRGAQIKVEGVYIWPFRQLRLVANRSLPITSVFDYSNCDFFFKILYQ